MEIGYNADMDVIKAIQEENAKRQEILQELIIRVHEIFAKVSEEVNNALSKIEI